MKQPIRIYGDPVLEQMCAEVKDFITAADSIKEIVTDLLDTCQATENSAGLAAPQIGIPLRIAVVKADFQKDDTDSYLVLINPRLLAQSGRCEEREGCLSIPGHWDKMTRAATVSVQYQTMQGELQEIKASGFFARALIHEIDHLEGRLFIHYFGRAYCLAIKDWLDRQLGGPLAPPNEPASSSTAAAASGDGASEVRNVADTETLPPLPEASFVQAERPEDDLIDDAPEEMADREG